MFYDAINLSIGIQMDSYTPIDRPVRSNISLENMNNIFSKSSCDFKCKIFRIDYYYYVFQIKFCWKTDRQCLRNEICTGAKKTLLVVSEVFGRHLSIIYIYIIYIYNFHLLVTDNLQ